MSFSNMPHKQRYETTIENGIENGKDLSKTIENGIVNGKKDLSKTIENGTVNGISQSKIIENGIENGKSYSKAIENGKYQSKTVENGKSQSKTMENGKRQFPDEILPFEMGYLPPYFKKKAEIELNESPENIENGIKLMREMAKRDKNFDGQTFDDDAILQFLRGKKFNISKAFARFRAFVILRRNTLEAFTNYSFEAMSVATRNNILTFLPRRCHEGCAILRVELDNWEPEEFPIEEVKRMVVVLMAQSLREPMTQVNGFKVIFNMKSNPIKHLRFCTPSNLYLMYHGTQNCVPARFKEIHIVNKSVTFNVGYMIVKPFMSQKIKQRLIFHNDHETLKNYFSANVLPVEYGGSLEDVDMTEWLRKVTQPDKLATIGGGPPPLPKNR